MSARLVACAQASQEALMVKTAAWRIARADRAGGAQDVAILGRGNTHTHTHTYLGTL